MKAPTTFLLLVATITATVQSAGCPYASQAGHCCNGSIYRSDPSGDLDDPSTWTCCQGASPSVVNSQGTCSSGNAISLADAPTVDGSGDSGGSSAFAATTSASVAVPNTMTTDSTGTSATSGSGAASSTSSVDPITQNSTNAANGMLTDASFVAAAIIAGGVTLAL